MATSKTLTPTNQTISIPELTDSPDMSVPADAIDKEADAINAINGKVKSVSWIPSTSTTLLAYINANVDKNYLPVSIVKAGSAVISDLPTGIATGSEFVANVFGSGSRNKVQLMMYGGGGKRVFIRDIFSGDWLTSWQELVLKSDIDTVDDLSSSISAYTGFTITDKYLRKNGKIVSLSVKLTAGSSDITFPAWQALIQMDASVKPPVSMNILGVVNYSQACNPYVAGSLANDKTYVSSASAITVPAGKTISICGTWMV